MWYTIRHSRSGKEFRPEWRMVFDKGKGMDVNQKSNSKQLSSRSCNACSPPHAKFLSTFLCNLCSLSTIIEHNFEHITGLGVLFKRKVEFWKSLFTQWIVLRWSFPDRLAPANDGPGQMTARCGAAKWIWHTCLLVRIAVPGRQFGVGAVGKLGVGCTG